MTLSLSGGSSFRVNKAWFLALGAGVSFAFGCGADPLYLNETDAVITVKAEGVDYSQYRRYYLPSRIVDLCLQPGSGTPTPEGIGGAGGGASIDPARCFVTDHSSDAAILSALESNMNKLGYERVSEVDRTDADLALLVGVVSRSSWKLDRAYCYPTNYYRGCVAQSANPDVTIPHNSIVLQLIDVDASSGSQLKSVWAAGIHQLQRISEQLGISSGGGPSVTKGKIWSDAIDQAFIQSPYLGEGGDQ